MLIADTSIAVKVSSSEETHEQELVRRIQGLGITIVSTPRGVLSDAEAREQNVGGEVLAEVF